MIAYSVNCVMATMAFGRPFKPDDPFFDGFLALSKKFQQIFSGRMLADLFPFLEPLYVGEFQ